MINRNTVISTLADALQPLQYVHAVWLEGADAMNAVDEYSDIDLWIDFDDECEAECYCAVENALRSLSDVDLFYEMQHPHPKIRQRIYHLADTSEYLMIDICWQLHSRPKSQCIFVNGSIVEYATVIFEKLQVVNFVEDDPLARHKKGDKFYRELLYRRSQHCRIWKYIMRGNFLESYTCYMHYCFEPLVDIIRAKYTPLNTEYGLTHISRHIPQEQLSRLEQLAKISTIEDISHHIPVAEKWFDELYNEL